MSSQIGTTSENRCGGPRTLGALLIPSILLSLSCSSDLTVKPRREVEVRGVIRDPEGVGVPGIEIFLDPADDKLSVGYAKTTDSAGAYLLRIAAGPYTARIFALHARVPEALIGPVTLVPPITRLDYRYGGLRVQGRLIGPGGNPIDAGTVEALGDAPGVFVAVTSALVAQRYKLFVPAATYYFRVEASPAYPGLPSLAIGGIPVAADTTIDFSVDGNRISGIVTIDGSTPLIDAGVTAYGATAQAFEVRASNRTAADGSYSVYLPAGAYGWEVIPGITARFVARRYFSGGSITAPQTMDFDLSGVDWSGTVRDTSTGSPIGSVDVMAVDRSRSYVSATSTSDPAGQFHLVLEPNRPYDIRLSSSIVGIAPKTISNVAAGNDSTFDLYVEPAAP